jgi:hypothetical protein
LVQAARQLVVEMQEETTVRIRYLTRPLPPAAVVVVLRLFLLLMEKMVVRAAAARKERQAAQEFRAKVLQGVLLDQDRHRAVAAAQVLLAQMERQAHRAQVAQAQRIQLPGQASLMPEVEAVVRRATKLAGQVEREEAATAATMVRQAQTERQILEVVGVRPVQTVELHPARAVLASSSSKCHRLLMPHFQAA